MNVNFFAVKKTQAVTFQVGKPVNPRDLGIRRLAGPAKDKLIMKLQSSCNNVLATA